MHPLRPYALTGLAICALATGGVPVFAEPLDAFHAIKFVADANNADAFEVAYIYRSKVLPGLETLLSSLGKDKALYTRAGTEERAYKCRLVVEREKWLIEAEDLSGKRAHFTVMYDGSLYYTRDNIRNRGQISTSVTLAYPRYDEFVLKVPIKYDFMQGTTGAVSYARLLQNVNIPLLGTELLVQDEDASEVIVKCAFDRSEQSLPAERLEITFEKASGYRPAALYVAISSEQNQAFEMPVVKCIFQDYIDVAPNLSMPKVTKIIEMTVGPAIEGKESGEALELRQHSFELLQFKSATEAGVDWKPPFLRGDQIYDKLTNDTYIVSEPLLILKERMRKASDAQE